MRLINRINGKNKHKLKKSNILFFNMSFFNCFSAFYVLFMNLKIKFKFNLYVLHMENVQIGVERMIAEFRLKK